MPAARTVIRMGQRSGKYERSGLRGRVRSWLVKLGLVFDPSEPGHPSIDADNPIHQGRRRANGVSNRA